jgi:prevent-host-death family protein
MEKSITAFEIRRQFGKVLQEVAARGDHYVVESHGEPVAAVVPIEVYEQWKRGREAFFAKIDDVAGRANLSPEQAEGEAREAVAAVRHSQRT